ncbi:hypothetical protein CAOG_06788 [Capsaspora owczarzaki ATCC 30864]|uniref:N-alpha-acetyltransferase 40 n=1 Tax=Capsaspora owczarzaki (strain ATCC 30864) TaxID=595528 RepID=A0A0D2WUS8_CAPO3|nr:hypothetical protein CAOG_06788 [Capsaspora owczarzaki ATCC 30864]KJE96465.1 hypothetical protein CAOG_006788 [Capsaspora owczarzaki ATCC 30864]|eukprot:XP_004344409.1 hypothetical protein CAOG_06788 [Capsaspora owczarzaki ATCC 30864]
MKTPKGLREHQKLLDLANANTSYLDKLKPFSKFNRNGLDVALSTRHASELSKEDMEFCFNLTKTNMETIRSLTSAVDDFRTCTALLKRYNASSWGWSDQRKRTELKEDTARFLLARSQSSADGAPGQLVAFVHFRFDFESTADEAQIPVIYCYEIQLSEPVQRKGLGKFMMQIIELIGIQEKMLKSMLTVFQANTSAIKFYRTILNYEIDEISPSQCDDDEADYEILSKRLPHRASLTGK